MYIIYVEPLRLLVYCVNIPDLPGQSCSLGSNMLAPLLTLASLGIKLSTRQVGESNLIFWESLTYEIKTEWFIKIFRTLTATFLIGLSFPFSHFAESPLDQQFTFPKVNLGCSLLTLRCDENCQTCGHVAVEIGLVVRIPRTTRDKSTC